MQYAIVIIDGASGEPIDEFGGLTSLEVSNTPALRHLRTATRTRGDKTMSWDVGLYRFDQVYASMEEIPDTAQRLVLGSQTAVRAAIDQVFSGTAWAGPEAWGVWGTWDSPHGSIEFNIGRDEQRVDSVALHVRATDAVVAGIRDLAERLDCQALDYTTGAFINAGDTDPARGLNAWRGYRDRVVAEHEQP